MCKIKLIIDTTDTAEGEWALDPARLLVWASLVIQMVKNLLAMWETWVQSLGGGGPLEEGMATHSSISAREIPWTEEPDEL